MWVVRTKRCGEAARCRGRPGLHLRPRATALFLHPRATTLFLVRQVLVPAPETEVLAFEGATMSESAAVPMFLGFGGAVVGAVEPSTAVKPALSRADWRDAA
ncbi:hypothetical protein SAV31267_010250 [Streptomyces avermitilis]|uniref:Uncharacterized protein n=1 Tax=Streptomyces avermitilis TaxID=33903 RepID=A0A4D4MHQ8_STRAX|nr:hypothetical protein SAV31267_010250 [Streptomyces avermitilis]